jgi:hypothetical protein
VRRFLLVKEMERDNSAAEAATPLLAEYTQQPEAGGLLLRKRGSTLTASFKQTQEALLTYRHLLS